MAGEAAADGGWFSNAVTKFNDWGKSDSYAQTKGYLGQIQGFNQQQQGYKQTLWGLGYKKQGLQMAEDQLVKGYNFNAILEQENLAMGINTLRRNITSLVSVQTAQAAANGTVNSRSSLMMLDNTLTQGEQSLIHQRQASMNRRKAALMEHESGLQEIAYKRQAVDMEIKQAKKARKAARKKAIIGTVSQVAAMFPPYGTAISLGMNMYSQAKYGE